MPEAAAPPAARSACRLAASRVSTTASARPSSLHDRRTSPRGQTSGGSSSQSGGGARAERSRHRRRSAVVGLSIPNQLGDAVDATPQDASCLEVTRDVILWFFGHPVVDRVFVSLAILTSVCVIFNGILIAWPFLGTACTSASTTDGTSSTSGALPLSAQMRRSPQRLSRARSTAASSPRTAPTTSASSTYRSRSSWRYYHTSASCRFRGASPSPAPHDLLEARA
mmetsp:Transcript_69964/g.192040  ORF Transcript_69964/g.192040 Transcript_69964/m.192040 type:complete len:225 (+) Transcript_69964:22-696(+)